MTQDGERERQREMIVSFSIKKYKVSIASVTGFLCSFLTLLTTWLNIKVTIAKSGQLTTASIHLKIILVATTEQ